MGCAPSSQSLQVSDNETRLLQEIDRLRLEQQTQQFEISKLRQENEKLREGQANGAYDNVESGYEMTEDGGHEVLGEEIEKLKLEQHERDRVINDLRLDNEELNRKLFENGQQGEVFNFIRGLSQVH